MSSETKTDNQQETGGRPDTADNGSGSLLALGLAAALMLAGYNFYQSSFGLTVKPAAGFYVVDSDRLAASYLTQAMSRSHNQDPDEVRRMLTQNLEQVQEKFSRMSDDGMIIVQRSAVVTYPKGADITEQVAQELGITLIVPQTGVSPIAVLPPASQPQDGGLPATSTAGGGAELD
ncbi:hypothetical protein [Neisseria yangbaofengii]|uniref:hypothetical protein n=1 Tax=Neisseria yangbaofengii TaxID=2709396 RepID=UPI0013EA7E77|nr:hypothetical protein [Neisseria yangbaofengii]